MMNLDIEDKPIALAAEENPNKRKAVEQEQEITVKVEPVNFCDFIIRYKNAVIHTHKVILMQQSKYFQDILEGDKDCKEVEIPEQVEPITKQVIPVERMVQLFKEFSSLAYEFDMQSRRFTENRYPSFEMIHFANYFNMTKAWSYMINWCRTINVFVQDGTPFAQDMTFSLECLILNSFYKWKLDKRQEEIVDKLSDKLYSAMISIDKYAQLWKLIPQNIEREIYVNFIQRKNCISEETATMFKSALITS